MIVRLRRDRDDGVVPEEITAGRKEDAANMVAVAVCKFLGGQIVAERQCLGDYCMVASGRGFKCRSSQAVPVAS